MLVGTTMAHPQSPSTTRAGPTPGTASTVDLDALFDVLTSRWRRRAIRHLAERPVAASADDFVTDLLSTHATTADPSETRISFYHAHLPKLADLDIVEYDPEAASVAPGRNLDEAAACLYAVREERAYLRGEN